MSLTATTRQRGKRIRALGAQSSGRNQLIGKYHTPVPNAHLLNSGSFQVPFRFHSGSIDHTPYGGVGEDPGMVSVQVRWWFRYIPYRYGSFHMTTSHAGNHLIGRPRHRVRQSHPALGFGTSPLISQCSIPDLWPFGFLRCGYGGYA